MADQGAGELEQAEVDVGAPLVAGAQPCEGVQPGEAAFDDPADLAQPGAVGHPAPRDPRGDAALAQQPAVLVEVVATVGEQLPRLASRPPWSPADGRDRVEQRQ